MLVRKLWVNVWRSFAALHRCLWFSFAAGQRQIVHMSQNVLTSLDYEIVVTRLVSSHYCRVSPASSLQDWRSSADTLKVSAQIRDQPGKCDTRLARFIDRFGHTKLDGLWSYMTIYYRTFADVYRHNAPSGRTWFYRHLLRITWKRNAVPKSGWPIHGATHAQTWMTNSWGSSFLKVDG